MGKKLKSDILGTNQILKILKDGNVYLGILMPFLLVKIFTFSQIPIFPTIQRVTYPLSFNLTIISSEVDSTVIIILIALTILTLFNNRFRFAGPPIVIFLGIMGFVVKIFDVIVIGVSLGLFVLILFYRLKKENSTKITLSRVGFVILLITLVIESYTFARWITYPIIFSQIYGNLSWKIPEIESNLYYVTSWVFPVIVMLIGLGFIFRPLVHPIIKFAKEKLNSSSFQTYTKTYTPSLFLLLIILGIAVFLPLYPYVPSINPNEQSLGVDTPFYIGNLENMKSSDDPVAAAFSKETVGDRPLFFIFMYGISSLFSFDFDNTVDFFPLILSPFYSFTIFLLVRTVTKNNTLSLVCGIFAALSHQLVAGMYAGFLANWLALGFVNLLLLEVYLIWHSKKKIHYFLFFLFIVTIFLIHGHTTTYVSLVIGIFFIITLFVTKQKKSSYLKISFLIIIIASVYILDQVRYNIFDTHGTLNSETGVVINQLNIENFSLRWSNFYYNNTIQYGGFISNSLIGLMALYWMITANYQKTFDRLLLASLFAVSFSLLFADYSIQSRFLYNTPFFYCSCIRINENFHISIFFLYYKKINFFCNTNFGNKLCNQVTCKSNISFLIHLA